MRDMIGGSNAGALARSRIPELTSMNGPMAVMIPVGIILKSRVPASSSQLSPAFGFVMSML